MAGVRGKVLKAAFLSELLYVLDGDLAYHAGEQKRSSHE